MEAIALPNNSDEATSKARVSTLLSPRFYTTDFAAMDRMGIDLQVLSINPF